MHIISVTFRDMEPDARLEEEARRLANHLDTYNDHVDRCEIAFEHPHRSASGNGGEYAVRLDMTVAGGKELVTRGSSNERGGLQVALRKAFRNAERRVKELAAKQRGHVKRHPEQAIQAVVTKVLDGYGFVEMEGREMYFHENSVVDANFNDLRVGSGVAITWEAGNDGPQVTSLRVVDGRGH